MHLVLCLALFLVSCLHGRASADLPGRDCVVVCCCRAASGLPLSRREGGWVLSGASGCGSARREAARQEGRARRRKRGGVEGRGDAGTQEKQGDSRETRRERDTGKAGTTNRNTEGRQQRRQRGGRC